MTDLTPEIQAELRRLLDATETPWALWDGYGPDGNGDMRVARIGHLSGSGIRADPDSADIYGRREAFELLASAVNALPALLDAAAERDALAESVRAYGRTIDRWGLLIIADTHSEDITTPDGDGDWEVIESRLAEVPALLAERDALAAAVERARVLATEWATQPTDYDEDTEQQIEDGNAILRALDATPETGREP